MNHREIPSVSFTFVFLSSPSWPITSIGVGGRYEGTTSVQENTRVDSGCITGRFS